MLGEMVELADRRQCQLGGMVQAQQPGGGNEIGWLMGARPVMDGSIVTIRRPDGSTFEAHGAVVWPSDGPHWDERPMSITWHVECFAGSRSWWEPRTVPVYREGETQMRLALAESEARP